MLMLNDVQMPSSYQPMKPLTPAEVSDGELLTRFVDQWDHEAFRDLVSRHGPMVLGVCRRLLRDAHAAEDAFQVTFLLLIRKAGLIRRRESVGSWLYGTAHGVAFEARRAAPPKEVALDLVPEVSAVDGGHGLDHDELHVALHEELGRLPGKYRGPLILCYIEGLSHEAVAR